MITPTHWIEYYKLSYGWCGILGIIFFSILVSAFQMAPAFWLSEWSYQNPEEQKRSLYPIVFAGIIVVYSVLQVTRALVMFQVQLGSITEILRRMTKHVLRAKMIFFDSNPLGRIMTRFTKETAIFDQIYNIVSIFVMLGAGRTISVAIMVSIIIPYALIPVAIACALIYLLVKVSKRHLQAAHTIDATEREPVHSVFGMMIVGLVSLRVSGRIPFFKQEFMNANYTAANAIFAFNSISRWMAIRLDILMNIFMSSVSLFCLFMKGRIEAKILLVTIQLISDLLAWFSFMVRFGIEINEYISCAQRMLDYTKMELEDELVKAKDKELKNWPSHGVIEYKSCSATYRKELPPAIKDLSFKVEAGMKVGIVGRTGSGKSSILQTLFRLLDLSEGSIEIDGVNINEAGLHLLRTNIAFIP